MTQCPCHGLAELKHANILENLTIKGLSPTHGYRSYDFVKYAVVERLSERFRYLVLELFVRVSQVIIRTMYRFFFVP